ncbi:hypothetical protein Hypma_010618 [Hypsizygus marmoreus]|uniref:Uncharacterized protein n=1 Tax=Hypsizygus marmoreus TaxID=39966 RepID=A0A369JIS6_HYPMA|nr:hypothetical protein Hypma_010618 [Hypsizygus marmoreus]
MGFANDCSRFPPTRHPTGAPRLDAIYPFPALIRVQPYVRDLLETVPDFRPHGTPLEHPTWMQYTRSPPYFETDRDLQATVPDFRPQAPRRSSPPGRIIPSLFFILSAIRGGQWEFPFIIGFFFSLPQLCFNIFSPPCWTRVRVVTRKEWQLLRGFQLYAHPVFFSIPPAN